jgi:hypothetical protein
MSTSQAFVLVVGALGVAALLVALPLARRERRARGSGRG